MILKSLQAIACIGFSAAGMIFLCLSLFGYEKTWTLPAALGCVAFLMLFQIIFHNGRNHNENT